MLTSFARKAQRSTVPHIAFTFNFTELPGRTQQRLMRWAFRDVEQFFAFSSYECDLYSRTFSIPRDRFRMLHFGFDLPIASTGVSRVRPDRYVSAVGGEGRDYDTLVDAMRYLPHIQLEIIARPHNIQSLVELPANVTIRTNLGLPDTHAIMQSSEFTVLPLAHDRVPCGHVTIVTSMHMGKAQIVTDSAGVTDYVEDEKTALLVRHGDSQDLAQKIERLWNDSEERTRLGGNGRKFAAEHCTNSSVASVFAEYMTTRIQQ